MTISMNNVYNNIKVDNKKAMMLLRLCVESGQTAMLWGPPGVGKTTMIYDLAKSLGIELCVINPSQDDIIDFKLPYIDDGEWKTETTDSISVKDLKCSKFAYSDRLPRGDKPGMVFVDELATASVAMQSTLFSLILEGRIGSYTVPKGTLRFAASNCEFHSSGANPVSMALKDRLMQHMYVVPSEAGFIEYANKHNYAPEIIGFVRSFPQYLEGADPDDPAGGCTPRSLEALSHKIKLHIPSEIANVVYNGTIGYKAGSDFAGFLQLYRTNFDLQEIIKHPKTSKIPEDRNVLFAITTGLGASGNENNIEAIFEYVDRLSPTYACIVYMDVTARHPKLRGHKSIVKFLTKNAKIIAIGV